MNLRRKLSTVFNEINVKNVLPHLIRYIPYTTIHAYSPIQNTCISLTQRKKKEFLKTETDTITM